MLNVDIDLRNKWNLETSFQWILINRINSKLRRTKVAWLILEISSLVLRFLNVFPRGLIYFAYILIIAERSVYQSLITPHRYAEAVRAAESSESRPSSQLAAVYHSANADSNLPAALERLRRRPSGALGRLRHRSRNSRRVLVARSLSRPAIPAASSARRVVCSRVAPSRCAIPFVPRREYETSATVARRGATGSVRFARICPSAGAGSIAVSREVLCARVQEVPRPREPVFFFTGTRSERRRRILASPDERGSVVAAPRFLGLLEVGAVCLCVLHERVPHFRSPFWPRFLAPRSGAPLPPVGHGKVQRLVTADASNRTGRARFI